jgi:hypothetical protein
MTKPFTGKIALDIRDSFPDWDPFLARNATTNGMATIAEFAAGSRGSRPASRSRAGSSPRSSPRTATRRSVPASWPARSSSACCPRAPSSRRSTPHGEPTATGPDGQPWPTLDTGWAWALADHQPGRHRTRGPRDRDPQGPLVRQRRPLQRPAARRPLGARTGPGRTSPGRRWRARRPQPRRQGPAPAVHLCVGRDSSSAVIPEYQAPFPLTGGTIDKVVVDVTGEHYIDHEAQVRVWFGID